MKTITFLFLQVLLLVCLFFAISYFPKLNSGSTPFEEEFESKAYTFLVPPQPTEPNTPSQPSQEPNEIPSPLPPEDNNTPQPSEKDWKGEDIRESPLNRFPTDKNLESNNTRCLRKDRRQEFLCQITGTGCLRYGPVQELAHTWLICALYSANHNKTARLYEFHKNFLSYVHLFGANTQTIEVTFPGQDYLATRSGNEPYELQYKAEWIFNMRENLVNVGSKHLPSDWEYIAWIDAHVFWENPYSLEQMIVELGRNNMVQVFASNTFTTEYNETRITLEGVGRLWQILRSTDMPPARQCGMAWATKRSIFEAMGGVLDVCIGMKCDLYHNYGYFGETYTVECDNSDYAAMVSAWQEKANKVIKKKVGYVKGNLIHFEHCLAKDACLTSSYDAMTSALYFDKYNPTTDLKRDFEGRLEFQSNWNLAHRLWGLYGGNARPV